MNQPVVVLLKELMLQVMFSAVLDLPLTGPEQPVAEQDLLEIFKVLLLQVPVLHQDKAVKPLLQVPAAAVLEGFQVWPEVVEALLQLQAQ